MRAETEYRLAVWFAVAAVVAAMLSLVAVALAWSTADGWDGDRPSPRRADRDEAIWIWEQEEERQAAEARAVAERAAAQQQLTTPPTPSYPWDALAECESGGNWSINTGNGFYGGLQFTLTSWRAVGGTGYPHQHSREEQIRRGIALQRIQGWGAWPACSRKIGLR